MIVSLKNIGTIEQASIDLDKDLIVFIGPNNTGKTYASYCLYGLRRVNYFPSQQLMDSVADINFENLFLNGSIDIDLAQILTEEKVHSLIEEYRKQFLDYLPQLFGVDKVNFAYSNIELSFNERQSLEEYISSSKFLISGLGYKGMNVQFVKKERVLSLYFSKKEENNDTYDEQDFNRLSDFIKRNIVESSFHPFINHRDAFFIPAERIGISVFSKDLFSSRFTKTNEILSQDVPNRGEIIDIMNKEFNVYSIVIQDALKNYEQFARGAERRRNSVDIQFRSLADELENNILKGKITTTKDGDVFFNTLDNKSIKLQSSGSIIKSLTTLILYLKNEAHSGQILIIDEPEINLHPDNQRLVARILAKLSKLGVKVIVSTHSDYFIRELNNLIMLNKNHPDGKALREKYGYADTEMLDYKKISTYLFKNHQATELSVTEKGMEAATIDDEINKLNNTANDIYWTLFED